MQGTKTDSKSRVSHAAIAQLPATATAARRDENDTKRVSSFLAYDETDMYMYVGGASSGGKAEREGESDRGWEKHGRGNLGRCTTYLPT